MRIGVDLDNVFVDWNTWVHQYNRAYKLTVSYFDARDYPTYDAIVDLTHFPSRNQFWKWAMAMPNFYGELEVMQGAQGAVYEMQAMGHDVIVTTARPAAVEQQTLAWLGRNWPQGIPSVFHSDKKLNAKCDLYIDDKPKVLNEVWASQVARAIKYEHPYNKDAMGYPARNWAEVLGIVEVLT